MFRKSTFDDIQSIMEIIKDAQEYLKKNDVNQWQNNYPNELVIENDISKNTSYVLEYDNEIVGTVFISYEGEPTYEVIDGNWITNGNYCVIHRLAISNKNKGRGYAGHMLGYIEELCKLNKVHSIRIDTHVENLAMRSLLHKNDFVYCGIIFLRDGAKRVAYEREVIYDI